MYVKSIDLKDLKIPKINSQLLLYLQIIFYQHNITFSLHSVSYLGKNHLYTADVVYYDSTLRVMS